MSEWLSKENECKNIGPWSEGGAEAMLSLVCFVFFLLFFFWPALGSPSSAHKRTITCLRMVALCDDVLICTFLLGIISYLNLFK